MGYVQTAARRRSLRDPRPALERACEPACARPTAPRPTPTIRRLSGAQWQPLFAAIRSSLRSLQRAARHLVELLAGRLPHARGVEGRRDAAARERGPIDGLQAPADAGRPELGERSLGLASLATARSGAAARRLGACLRRTTIAGTRLLELGDRRGCEASTRCHRRDRPGATARMTSLTPTCPGPTPTASRTSRGRGTSGTANCPASQDYDGTPTEYGEGFRDHLATLG